ncbi:MAG TPA: J domain-containing protein [Malonomonas sp.]
MPQISEAEVLRACRTLFGPELQLNRDFLHYLQPSGVRTAFRNRAKQTHPDRFAIAASPVREKQHRLFQDLNQAHETLQHYMKQRKVLFSSNRPSYQHAQQPRHPDGPPQSRYYRGQLPPRALQFGLFLYYLGIIPFGAVISAISWQRQQRPILGDIARRWGWLDLNQIKQVLTHRNGGSRFGERAEQLGLLTPLQVRAMLLHQRSRQQQMGQFFIEQGFFNEETLNLLLGKLAEHNQNYRHGSNGQYYFYHRN